MEVPIYFSMMSCCPRRFLLLSLCLFLSCSPQKHENPNYLEINAVPFGPSEDERDDYYDEIKDIQADGEHIFVNTDGSGLFELDQDGRKVQIYGKPGQAPSFLRRIVGSAVAPELVWILDGRARLHCYERGTGDYLYSANLRISSGSFHTIYTRKAAANPLIHHDHRLLLPIFLGGENNTIATLVDEQGQLIQHINDPDFLEIHDRDLPGWRRTIWVHDKGFWYCAYMYRHRILKFDKNFNKMYDVVIRNFATDRYDDWVSDATSMTPFYWDMDHSESSLFLIAQDGVDQIDKNTGRFLRKIVFRYFTDLVHDGELRHWPITFSTFAVKKGGLVILAPNHPRDLKDNLFQASLLDKLDRSDL